ncbi:hypothetical protein Prudu_000497 [Prunus dulcis]|uniref:Beta-carotene isomerase D27-like C-terminal domain-containing protein n=1 Tax=Prunus dulcis TaxID=3755 RepID=A0A4Y1QLH2_PRUDU|nr:hypothetical protein Prudu_000497 [Prunus dulcis]
MVPSSKLLEFHLRKMKALAVVRPPSICSWPPQSLPKSQYLRSQRFRVSSSLIKESQSEIQAKQEKKGGGVMDEVFLNLFRKKMVEEVGWDSRKPGYDGLIEVANRLMLISPTNSHTKEAAVRILRSLFPPMLLQLYKLLIAPIQGGKVAAIMVARVTAITCEWLMGPCTVNSVDLPDGTSWNSGLSSSDNEWLWDGRAFMKDYMGVPLVMEPNFSDYSCQFKFGVPPPLPEDDATLKEPCLDICPNATRRREFAGNINVQQCPKA